MAKPNKAKAHHSFLRNDALGCNVPNIQKIGKGLKKILQVHLPQINFFVQMLSAQVFLLATITKKSPACVRAMCF